MKTASELLTPKLARRFAELDAALELAPGNGVAEDYLSGILNQIIEGDFEVVTDGWEFEHGKAWARERLAALAAKWKAEDAEAEFLRAEVRRIRAEAQAARAKRTKA